VEWREWRKGSGGRELEKGVEEKARQEWNDVPATAMIQGEPFFLFVLFPPKVACWDRASSP
jgi:hypothetical protein